MRIFLLGQAAFGQDVFQKLRGDGEEVVAVAAPAQSLSGRPDRLRSAADESGVPAFDIARLGDGAIEQAISEHDPELGVMAFVSERIPAAILSLPAHGTIQYHPSLLPRHRGRSSINWAIIQGDRRTGVSIFWPDEGLDTGPLLLQRDVAIGPDDTTGSLYYERLYPMGVEMLAEAVQRVKRGDAPRLPQDEALATYDRPCTDATVRIDWRLPATAVYNLIRGADPSPGAWTRFGDQNVRLLDARLQETASTPPGVIESIGDAGVIVGGDGGSLLVRKMQAGARPQPAHEVAAAIGLSAGVRFLNPRRQAG
jgi:methionyl-tRNA formyltransferase